MYPEDVWEVVPMYHKDMGSRVAAPPFLSLHLIYASGYPSWPGRFNFGLNFFDNQWRGSWLGYRSGVDAVYYGNNRNNSGKGTSVIQPVAVATPAELS
jgi:hypothetical protein